MAGRAVERAAAERAVAEWAAAEGAAGKERKAATRVVAVQWGWAAVSAVARGAEVVADWAAE